MIRVAAVLALAVLSGCANSPADLTDSDYIWEEQKTEMAASEMWRHMRREFRSCGADIGHLYCLESSDLKSFECDAGWRNPDVALGRFYINEGESETTVRLSYSSKVPLFQQGRMEKYRKIVSGETGVCKDS